MNLLSFQDSIFLSALGKAIMSSIWQALVLWIVFELILLGVTKNKAIIKHNLSVIFVFCSFLLFTGTFIINLKVDGTLQNAMIAFNNLTVPDKSKSSFWVFFEMFTHTLLPYLSLAYLFLLVLLLGKLFHAYRQVHSFTKRNLIIAPDNLVAFANRVVSEVRIPRAVSIWIHRHIEVPSTIGFLKPVILIPLASINHLSTLQLEAIILHELAHIKRNDYLINLILALIGSILFFNPFIVYFINIIKRERENCCDDFVLNYQYDPHSYATALLQLEQSRYNQLPLALGAVSDKNQLFNRIKRMTGSAKSDRSEYIHKVLALFATTLVFGFIAWLVPATQQSSESVKESLSSVQEKPTYSDHKDTLNYEQPSTRNQTILPNIRHKNGNVDIDLSVNNIPIPPYSNSNPQNEHAQTETVGAVIDTMRSIKNMLSKFSQINLNNLQVNINEIFSEKEIKNLIKETSHFDWEKINDKINSALNQRGKQLVDQHTIAIHEVKKKLEKIPTLPVNISTIIDGLNEFKFILSDSIHALNVGSDFQLSDLNAIKLAVAQQSNKRNSRVNKAQNHSVKEKIQDDHVPENKITESEIRIKQPQNQGPTLHIKASTNHKSIILEM